MSLLSDAYRVTCPDCGAEQPPGKPTSKCWMCGGVLGEGVAQAVAARPVPQPVPKSFSLGTLMLLITLISVVLGLTALQPGLGILAMVLLTPALVRTFGIVGRRKAERKAVTLTDKIGTLFASLCVVTVIGGASAAAFVATCFPLGLAVFTAADGRSEAKVVPLFIGAFVVGFAAAGAVAFFLSRALWRRRQP